VPDTTLQIVIAIFLIAHGFVHMGIALVPVSKPEAPRTPFWPAWWRPDIDKAWLASRLGLAPAAVRTPGSLLWAIALVGFVVAGLGLIGIPGLVSIWQAAAILGSIASLVLLIFYWHPWLVMAVLIDLSVLAGILVNWPAVLFPKL
jgi:hypothetical protein